MLLAIGYACSQTQDDAGSPISITGASVPKLAAANESSAANVAAAGAASVLMIHGRIVAVDEQQKLITLQAASGKQVILHVLNPYTLVSAKPGDLLGAKFYEIASVQQLAPGQAPPAQSLTAGIVNAAPGDAPLAALVSQYQFTVTIDAIDKNDKTISINGSDGVVEVVNVANPERLEQVQAGEQIVVTLIDVVAIELDKENGSVSGAPAI
jgi:hypothetical protein